MNKVFEPGIELGGDPSRVIEIQEKVKELLEANQQRREGIKEEISAYGAWALPGLINATYVWMHDMENEQRQAMLAGMMASLARENMPAIDLLFRGVLDTPFEVPRSIARRALEQLDWKPSVKNTQQIEKQIALYQEMDDVQSMVDLYGLLLRTGQEHELNLVLNRCKQWVRRSLQSAGDLFVMLLKAFPNQAERILAELLIAATEARQDAHRDEDIANMFVRPLAAIPPEWLLNGVLLNASIRVLRQVQAHRHTGVEYLWIRAVQDLQRGDLSLWRKQFPRIGEQIQKACKTVSEDEKESIYRYWFRALGEVDELDYICQEARKPGSGFDPWAGAAALQLFFQNSDRKAVQALRELEAENGARYEHAKNRYNDLISGRRKSRGGTQTTSRTAGLTVKAR